MPNQPPNKIQTIEITNFGGRLTRLLNGDLNSGFAKFTTSFGYDPFSKPMNLTWLEKPVDITGPINDLILAGKTRFEAGALYVYAIGSSGNLYKIQPNSGNSGTLNPNVDSVVGISSVMNGTAYDFGSDMDFYGASYPSVLTEKIYVSHDNGVNSINFDGTSEVQVTHTSSVVTNIYHPLKQFIGNLIFGNKNNIGLIQSTGTVTSPTSNGLYAQLQPGFPNETYITDMNISPDGNYLIAATSGTSNENILTVSDDRPAAAASNGNIYYWNGTDLATTAQDIIPSYAITALQTYVQNQMFFSDDAFGSSLSNGTQKLLSLPNNKSPFPHGVIANGNFLCWIVPEQSPDGTTINASLYYFGNLDEENQPGLWRVMRYSSSLSNGFIYQTPFQIMTNNRYSTVNNAITSVQSVGLGKHYFSTMDINASTTSMGLKRFLITPSGTGTPQLGVYETQTQLFSKRATIKQVRVYTEPTATNQGFQLDLIGSDGAVITNGTFNYTYASGTDITKLQGSLERINFNPSVRDTYALGIRITNTGTANMTIHKMEIDWVTQGK